VTFAVPGAVYDRFVGRYSYRLCQALARAAGLAAESSVLDVGASTGEGTRYPGEMNLLRAFWDAAGELDSDGVRAVDERMQMRFGRRGELGALWRHAGLEDVKEGDIVVFAEYESFDDLWEPFTAGVGPAGSYAASLDPERQEALRTEYSRRLAVPDGGFRLSARAWDAVAKA
jgi:hypothetical protein